MQFTWRAWDTHGIEVPPVPKTMSEIKGLHRGSYEVPVAVVLVVGKDH